MERDACARGAGPGREGRVPERARRSTHGRPASTDNPWRARRSHSWLGGLQVSTSLLEVDGLRTHFFTKAGVVKAVDDVSFTVARGEVVGLVGESGSGKSMTGYSLMGLIDPP